MYLTGYFLMSNIYCHNLTTTSTKLNFNSSWGSSLPCLCTLSPHEHHQKSYSKHFLFLHSKVEWLCQYAMMLQAGRWYIIDLVDLVEWTGPFPVYRKFGIFF